MARPVKDSGRVGRGGRLQEEEAGRIQAALLGWYGRCGRKLPWRARRDPYAIWVSEVMLQQTQVATVVPYYERFMERFWDVGALAGARLDEVLKVWQGLGYYGRARRLHEAAGVVVREYGGQLPSEAGALVKLPGIGRYTAGAIASIAFGRDEPVLDGNVTRVLCRVFCIRTLPGLGATQRRLWQLAGALLPAGQAGQFNQALMELGATLCSVVGPACEECPLGEVCGAYGRGEQERLPRRAARKAVPLKREAVGVIVRRGRVLISRRPAEGLLGGLWQFPSVAVDAGEAAADVLGVKVGEQVGLEVEAAEALGVVRHAYSHFRLRMEVFLCRARGGRVRAAGQDKWAGRVYKWVRLGALEDYAFCRASEKVMAMLGRRGV